LSWDHHLLYQLSRADIDLVSMEGAIALTDQGGTEEAKAEKILTNNQECAKKSLPSCR